MMTIQLRLSERSTGVDIFTKTMEGFDKLSKLVKLEEIRGCEEYKMFIAVIEDVEFWVFSPTIPADTPAETPE